jgi:hypothetical protein
MLLASVVFLILRWSSESRELTRSTWVYVTLGVLIALGAIADELVAVRSAAYGATVWVAKPERCPPSNNRSVWPPD